MEFRLTPEQELMRESIRRLTAQLIMPLLAKHGRNEPLPKPVFLTLLAKLAALGMTTPRIPVSAGGAGISMLDYGILFEQIPAAIGLSLLSHESCIARLHAEGNHEQRKRFLPALIAGGKIGCTGATEPDTGSDPRGIKTKITQQGDELIINGRKMWITNVSACDLIIITGVDHRDGETGGKVIKVVIEREHSPFEAKEIDTIGLRQGMLGEAVFDNCRVPLRNLIQSPAGGTQMLKATWTVNRPLIGLLAVQLAQQAFDIALDFAKTRKQFGKVIAGHQLIQKNLSDIATAITASRLLCYHALALVDSGGPADGAAAMAKRFAQNACQEAAWQAMNILGAMGLATEARIEALYRDIRMLPVPDGTNEILALIHGRELTGVEAFRGTGRAKESR